MLSGVQFACGYMDDLSAATSLVGAYLFQVVLHFCKDAIPMVMHYHTCWTIGNNIRAASPSQAMLDFAHALYGPIPHCAAVVTGPHWEQRCYSHQLGYYLHQHGFALRACDCNTKLYIVPHRELTKKEIACFDATPWGPMVFVNSIVFLELTITSLYDWGNTPFCSLGETVDLARMRINYQGPLLKAELRAKKMRCSAMSPLQKGIAWNVYIVTLLPTLHKCTCPLLQSVLNMYRSCKGFLPGLGLAKTLQFHCMHCWIIMLPPLDYGLMSVQLRLTGGAEHMLTTGSMMHVQPLQLESRS